MEFGCSKGLCRPLVFIPHQDKLFPTRFRSPTLSAILIHTVPRCSWAGSTPLTPVLPLPQSTPPFTAPPPPGPCAPDWLDDCQLSLLHRAAMSQKNGKLTTSLYKVLGRQPTAPRERAERSTRSAVAHGIWVWACPASSRTNTLLLPTPSLFHTHNFLCSLNRTNFFLNAGPLHLLSF